MPSKEELQRRKALTRGQADQAKAAAIAALPLPQAALSALFDHLDEALADGCDHSLSLTRAFLQASSLPEDAILEWLRGQGGYCDCEVLANVEPQWED